MQERAAEAAQSSSAARLQFRFTDGSSVISQFAPEQTLMDARRFVEQTLREMNQSVGFSMHSSFPKREYTTLDMPLTLRELGLAPSASLLIIPVIFFSLQIQYSTHLLLQTFSNFLYGFPFLDSVKSSEEAERVYAHNFKQCCWSVVIEFELVKPYDHCKRRSFILVFASHNYLQSDRELFSWWHKSGRQQC